jgi:tetratricopeptide (TPR) repeat protein
LLFSRGRVYAIGGSGSSGGKEAPFMAHRLRIPCAVVAVACCFACALVPQGRAEGGDSWAGKRILTKRARAQIVSDVVTDKRKVVATLEDWRYLVEEEKGGFLQVRHRGVAGWLPKEDAVLVDEAVGYFTDQIRKDSKDARAYACRAKAWEAKDDYDRAIKDSSEAIRLQPEVAAWRIIRGQVWEDKKDYAKALVDYDEAIRLDPKSPWAFGTRGEIWSEKEEYAKALADFDEAIRLDPEDAEAFSARGYVWLNKGDFDKALADFDEAIHLDPKDARAFGQRGYIWSVKREYDKAVADLTEAARLDPKDSTVFNIRGVVLAAKMEYDKAVADFTVAIRLDPKLASAFHTRGVLWLSKRVYDRALDDLDQAIRLDPKLNEAFLCRAWLLAACPEEKYRDGKRAVETARRGCELTDWKDPRYLEALAAAYAERGDLKQAVKYQKQALDFPENFGVIGIDAGNRLDLYEAGKPFRLELPESINITVIR